LYNPRQRNLIGNPSQTTPRAKGGVVIRNLFRLGMASRRCAWLIIAITALGFLLRLWGIQHGLPYIYHPDEPVGVNIPLRMFQTGDFNPHFFGYGSLFFYLNAIAYIPYYLLGVLSGAFQSPSDIPALQSLGLGVTRTLLPSQISLGRSVSVIIGALCIPLAGWIGSRLSNRQVGWLAAAFVALSAPLVLHSQFITPNILATFTVLLTLATLMRLTPQSGWASYALVGVCMGLAIASKYNAALLTLSCATTYFILKGRDALRDPRSYLSLAVAALAFVAATPYAILDFPKFVEDTQFHLSYYMSASHAGMEGNSVEYYLNYVLSEQGLIAFAGLLFAVSYFRRRDHNGLILSSYAIPYTLYIATLRLRNDRTILITLPIFLIMAADGLYAIWRMAIPPAVSTPSGAPQSRLRTFNRPHIHSLTRWGVVAFALMSILYSGWRTIDLNIRAATPDVRTVSLQWINDQVPPGARIAIEPYTPFIDPAKYDVTYYSYLIRNSPDWYTQQKYDLLIASSAAYQRFYNTDLFQNERSQYEQLFEHFPEIMRFDQNGIIIRILKVQS
jgi:4-amino-4-deoxy-L-arabinose transferase-like glycosyltransferase